MPLEIQLQDSVEGEGSVSYGEARVNQLKAKIYKSSREPTKKEHRVKCGHCLTFFSSGASLRRHIAAIASSSNEPDDDKSSLCYLPLREIQKAFYGTKAAKPTEDTEDDADDAQDAADAPAVRSQEEAPAVSSLEEAPEVPEAKNEKEPKVGEKAEPKVKIRLRYQCGKCQKLFASEETLDRHIAYYHARLLCDECGAQFPTRRELTSHVRKHRELTAPRNYACEHCPARERTRCALKKHMSSHPEVFDTRYECGVCRKQFTRVGGLRAHEKIHTNLRTYRCSCGKAFKRVGNLQAHVALVHGITKNPKKHICHVCSKAYNKPAALEVHLMKHAGVEPFRCKLCSRSFTSNLALHVHASRGNCHVQKKHCTICKKTFAPNEPLCGHVGAHKILNRVKLKPPHIHCPQPLCKRSFWFNCELKEHTRIAHTDSRPFHCHCGSSFKSAPHLRVHMNTHGDVSFPCSLCEKRFRSKSYLSIHMLAHTGEKPHSCVVCGRAFTQASDMRKHARKLHGLP